MDTGGYRLACLFHQWPRRAMVFTEGSGVAEVADMGENLRSPRREKEWHGECAIGCYEA